MSRCRSTSAKYSARTLSTSWRCTPVAVASAKLTPSGCACNFASAHFFWNNSLSVRATARLSVNFRITASRSSSCCFRFTLPASRFVSSAQSEVATAKNKTTKRNTLARVPRRGTPRSGGPLLRGRLLRVGAVRLERPGRSKFTEPMTDHVLRDEHRLMNFAVVHEERVPDKLRYDHRPARPRLDRLLLGHGHLLDLCHEV